MWMTFWAIESMTGVKSWEKLRMTVLSLRGRPTAYHGVSVEVVMCGEPGKQQGLLDAQFLREAVVKTDGPSIGMKLFRGYACLTGASRCTSR